LNSLGRPSNIISALTRFNLKPEPNGSLVLIEIN
jgi:hypothetical protein